MTKFCGLSNCKKVVTLIEMGSLADGAEYAIRLVHMVGMLG